MVYLLLDIIAFLSTIMVCWRLRYYLTPTRRYKSASKLPLISMIIPARNESANLPTLLQSIGEMSGSPTEVIVVNDFSNDNTAQIAAAFGATVIDATTRPPDWAAKNWVCHLGAQNATGDYLLFTDADTIHSKNSLQIAVNFLQRNNLDMMSTAPYHLNHLWWEKLLGPYYCILECGGSSFEYKTHKDIYAVGQYMLVKRDAYVACGGHEKIKGEIAEDVALARSIVNAGFKYRMYRGAPLYSVQMYKSLSEFAQGWNRLLRLGMRNFSIRVTLNSLFPLLALNIMNLFNGFNYSYFPLAIMLTIFAVAQIRLGNFSIVGVLLFPFGVLLFLTLSICAMVSELFRLPLRWKGRVYQ